MKLDDQYFEENFNTELDPANEKLYQNWLIKQSELRQRDVSKDVGDYDVRGYWLNGGYADKGSGHGPDTYKKPNHPTFSDQSIYHGTPSPLGFNWEGGTWADDGSTYTPSATMLKHTHKLDFLKNYFSEYEPNTKLILERKK